MNLIFLNIISKFLIYTKTYQIIRYIYYKYYDYFNSDLLRNNINLYKIHKNKRCFIFAGGRSLNEIDFSKIKKEYSEPWINYHSNIFHSTNAPKFLSNLAVSIIPHQKHTYFDIITPVKLFDSRAKSMPPVPASKI